MDKEQSTKENGIVCCLVRMARTKQNRERSDRVTWNSIQEPYSDSHVITGNPSIALIARAVTSSPRDRVAGLTGSAFVNPRIVGPNARDH